MLDLVTIYDIFTCKEMPYNNTLRSLREVRFCFLFFFFFFLAGEADSRTRTCALAIAPSHELLC